MRIGTVEIDSRLALAPMAGVTDVAFRQICRELGCKLMYISTDYVFDGQGEDPWQPDCKDFAPLNVYGQTKLEGELAVRELLEKYFIVRIAWVFGLSGKNFIRTMLRLGQIHSTLRVVSDQVGTPTYTSRLNGLPFFERIRQITVVYLSTT